MGVAFGMTDVGMVRVSNQDNFHIAPELGLLAVADGMGGHAGGEIASADAITLLCGFIAAASARDGAFDPAADPDATWAGATTKAMVTVHDAVAFANARIYEANVARNRADGMGMGTTLTGMWQPAPHGPAFIFHVGDSRLYCWRGGKLEQLTRDQTLYQQALDVGAPGPLPPRNLLLQAIGPTAAVDPQLTARVLAPGDVYLLCSDGLYGDSDEAAIAAIVSRARDDNLDACCAELVAMARRDGGRDNITALLLRCRAG
ncbi:SpoIIE family protein phosphatase [Massilia dura]|uniref:SpoIIE family protein phosphatase n=2 Tax=Pseudoduganella dura TaxID=321982 RepID=A0A6I3XLU4_9BURK|nr:SpoIIE family protein phosphatase [Pseudoduganella dura]